MQLIRFIAVGGSAALVHLVMLWSGVNLLSLAPVIANLLAFTIAFIVSYLGQSLWTFGHKQHTYGAVVRYLMVQLFCSLALNQGLFTLLITCTPLHYLIASFIVLVTVPVATFTLSKYWAFR